uniref:Sodium/hydrogen exchanger n=1 Tax=Geobacter sp. (strain M21) TaxID=443144 RepID=C6E851_GEOSM
MHEMTLLINIAVALVAAFFGGLAARRLGLPPIVGYMLAGIAIGPFTPGFVGDLTTIGQLAEMGVIFLMFGVGLHFSLKDLWRVRSVAVPGALGQMLLATLLGVALSRFWGWSTASGLVLGFSISIASTVVLLRGLMDNGLLNTPHGQAAVGWLILEDLATVFILIVMPSLAASGAGLDWLNLGVTLFKAGAFVLLLMFVGQKLIPWLLLTIAHTKSRELFILAVLALALGTAIGAAEIFGVSLALGAFMAGVLVGRSPLSHQVGADLLPFREAFSVLFFVSIGMLVNPGYLVDNLRSVLALAGIIMIGKPAITMLMGLVFPWPARTALVVSAGLSQIGEFSFILGQAGMSLNFINRDQYSLILAGALCSITLNPAMFRLIRPAEKWLQRFPFLWRALNRHGPAPAPIEESMAGHVVIVGFGQVGRYIVTVLGQVQLPHLVVETDATRVEELGRLKVPTLFGDAANSEVLEHACLNRARALVVTVPEEAASQLIVSAARALAPALPVIVRAATDDGVRLLAGLGAQHIVQPQLEGGLEIVRHTLLQLGFPLREVYRYADAVRRERFVAGRETGGDHRLLDELIGAVNSIEITWITIAAGTDLAGQTLEQAAIRSRTGASVVALQRDRKLMANPQSVTVLMPGDRLGLIGEWEQLEAAEKLFSAGGVTL